MFIVQPKLMLTVCKIKLKSKLKRPMLRHVFTAKVLDSLESLLGTLVIMARNQN